MDSVALLKLNVEKLLTQVEKLKEQNRHLMARAVAAESRADNTERKNLELQEQLTSSLLKNSITEVAGGNKAARARITKLIKDIDKCIAISSSK